MLKSLKEIFMDSNHSSSPCIGICRLSKNEPFLCEGCFRSIDEISKWSTATEMEKKIILQMVKIRSQAVSFQNKS